MTGQIENNLGGKARAKALSKAKRIEIASKAGKASAMRKKSIKSPRNV